MSGPRVPGLGRHAPRRVLMAAGIALAGELSAVGLLATGAWLLLSAALRPPILLLSVAIGVVQVLSLLRGITRYAERRASHNLGLGFQAALRTWLYRRLEPLVPVGLPGGDRGDLLARLISDTEEAQDLVVRAVVPVLAAAVAWCAVAAAAAALLPVAGWAILAVGLVGMAGVTVSVLLVGRSAAALPAARGAVGSWALGMLTSAEEVTALCAESWVLAQLAERERALGARTRAVAAATGLGRACCLFAGGAGLAAVSWAGATAQRAGRISGVDLGVLVFLALGVAGMLQGLPDAVSRLQVSMASLERLARLGRVRAPVAAVDASGDGHQQAALALAATPAAVCVPSSRRVAIIALRDASIAHSDGAGPGQGPLIRDLNLDLLPGRPVALAGPSGSGKTSVVFALLRFIDLSAGRLIIDGADALAMPPERFRELMAWSPERPTLFPVTLRANMRVGAPHATDGEITEILVRLGLGPWLEQLEAGLDTVIASWGHPVSGGELQRLSVARALLADRPVLLLDEPTCHLDPDTAAAVTGAVLELAADRSLLWVTHRPEELRQFPDVCRLNPVAVSSH